MINYQRKMHLEQTRRLSPTHTKLCIVFLLLVGPVLELYSRIQPPPPRNSFQFCSTDQT